MMAGGWGEVRDQRGQAIVDPSLWTLTATRVKSRCGDKYSKSGAHFPGSRGRLVDQKP